MNCPHCDHYQKGIDGTAKGTSFWVLSHAMTPCDQDPWATVSNNGWLYGCPWCRKTFVDTTPPY